MARPLRLQRPGAIYHAMNRGNARQDIFRDDHDRKRFLSNLEAGVQAHGVRLYLFVLMPNHVHFLFETPHANISAFMQSLLSGYTTYFNRRHHTVGHLFQGRFKAQVVKGDEYLLRLSRYIHLNPVAWDKTHGFTLREKVRRLRAYPWSTYPSYAGLAEPLPFVDYAPILAMMAPWAGQTGQSAGQAAADGGEPRQTDDHELPGVLRRAYRRFVETGLAHSDEGFRRLYAMAPLALGDERFRQEAEEEYARLVQRAARPEDVALRHRAARVNPERVLWVVGEHFGLTLDALRQPRQHTLARAAAAWFLRKYARLSHRRAAALLGWGSGVAVGIQVRRLQAQVAQDEQLAAELAELEQRLLKADQLDRPGGLCESAAQWEPSDGGLSHGSLVEDTGA